MGWCASAWPPGWLRAATSWSSAVREEAGRRLATTRDVLAWQREMGQLCRIGGFEKIEYELTPDALELGLGAALPATLEIGKERGFGRGERGSPFLTQP